MKCQPGKKVLLKKKCQSSFQWEKKWNEKHFWNDEWQSKLNNEPFKCSHSLILQIIRISIECFSPAGNVNLFQRVLQWPWSRHHGREYLKLFLYLWSSLQLLKQFIRTWALGDVQRKFKIPFEFVMLPLEWMNNPQRLKGIKTLYYQQNHPKRYSSFSYSMYKYLRGIHIWVSCHSPGFGWPCDTQRHPAIWISKASPRSEALVFRWSRALCSHRAGVAHRAGVLSSGIFANKRTVLAELAAAICILNQAVSADAVPRRVIAMQGARAAALQWLLLAVTAINHRDGWSGSAEPHVNKHTPQHIWQMFGGEPVQLSVAAYHTNNVTRTGAHRHGPVGCILKARLI